MPDLIKLIKAERSKGNVIRSVLNDGISNWGTEEVIREIGSDELYRIAKDEIGFDTKMDLELLSSDSKMIVLMEAYLADPQSVEDPTLPKREMKELVHYYKELVKDKIEYFVRQANRGYEDHW